MQKIIPAFLCAAILFVQNVCAQTWANLGSNEQADNHITKTAAFPFYMQSSKNGEPCFSFIDDDFGPNNAGDFKIHFRKYNGTQWMDLGNGATPSFPANDFFPIAFDDNTAYMAYSEPGTTASAGKITVRKFNNATGQWETVGAAAFSAGAANATAIAASSNKVYVAYSDGSVAGKVTVKVFDNANAAAGWQTVGITGFSAGDIFPNPGSGISLVIDNGIPYISYVDMSLSAGAGAMVVKQFNGTAWQDVGTNSPSNGHLAVSATIRFDAQHNPYIAYLDALDAKGYVRKLNVSNQWVSLGAQPPVGQVFANMSLHILRNHVFVAFAKPDNVSVSQVGVKQFDPVNNTWNDVGTTPITTSTTGVTSVALESDGQNKLFLVYRNGNGAIYAKSFDATAILPISLSAFTAVKQQGHGLLQWATSFEDNNLEFEVQHSIDGSNFATVGTVLGKGNTTIGHQYSFIHTIPANGTNYYRLKQVNKNGSFTVSNTISLDFGGQDIITITVFPNPVRDVLHVQYSMKDVRQVVVKDAAGRTIKQFKAIGYAIDIPVNDLAKGTYFVCLYNGSQTANRLFVK